MNEPIREATIDELSLATVQVVLARCVGDPTPASLERARHAYTRGAKLYVHADAGQIRGVIGVREGSKGHKDILHLAVAPGSERQGIGRRLVRHVCDEHHARTVGAETDADAVGFYRALGFTVESLGERYPGRERYRCLWSGCEGLLMLTAADPDDPLEIWCMLQEIPETENGFGNGAHGLPRERWREHMRRVVEISHGVGLKPDHVPQTTYWLWSEDRPVGIAKLRHRLNDHLLRRGGHAGYSIRPTERGKGFGNAIFRLATSRARLYGIKRLLLTCDTGNTLSRKVIERNRGVLQDETAGTCRYWIDLA